MPSIGIDFGTTNSLIVAYDKIKNEFTYFNFSERGDKPIPHLQLYGTTAKV